MEDRSTKVNARSFRQEILAEIELVTPAEAAQILNCSERDVMNLICEGKLHGYCRKRKTRGIRLLASELKEYVQSIKEKHE